MNTQLREKAIHLRKQEALSYTAIQKRLNVPKSTLSYWLREFPLSEERILELRRQGWQRGEASRERFRATMRKKRELKNQEAYERHKKRMSTLSQDAFFVAGLMLYSGEGAKKDYTKLSLANTDPEVIKFFIQWLDTCLGIPKEKVKAALHLYENMNIKQEKEFWKKELGFQESQFYKTQIRKLQKSSFSYSESFRHGTCSVYIGGVDKHREVMTAIQAFFDCYK